MTMLEETHEEAISPNGCDQAATQFRSSPGKVIYVLDTERGKTPTDPRGALVEIAVVKCTLDAGGDLHVGETVSFLVRPEGQVVTLDGFPVHELSAARSFTEVAPELIAATGFNPDLASRESPIWVAHKAAKDLLHLREGSEFRNWFLNVLCTDRLARDLKTIRPNFPQSLAGLCEHLEIPFDQNHRAGPDAQALALVLQKLLKGEVPYAYDYTRAKVIQCCQSALEAAHVPESVKNLPRKPGLLTINGKNMAAYDLGEEAYRHWVETPFKPGTKLTFLEHKHFMAASHAFIQKCSPKDEAESGDNSNPTANSPFEPIRIVDGEDIFVVVRPGAYSLNGQEYVCSSRKQNYALKRLTRYYQKRDQVLSI